MNPWDKAYRPRPLDPSLYSMAQRLAAEDKLPRDHSAWTLDAAQEQLHFIDWSTPELIEDLDEDWMVNNP